jgi:hypothetical protein
MVPGVVPKRVLPHCYPETRKVVGATGFEPATPCAQAIKRAFFGVFLQSPIWL